jgi:enamine deaminase RidA (YjgF/YER057c/UK114 family)
VLGATAGGDATLRRLRAGLIPATAASAVAFVSGCGGGGDRLSAEEFQRQANAICQKYDERIQAIGSPTSPAEIPDFVSKGVPILRQGIAELRSLKPPAELRDDYDRMLDETQKAIPAAQKLAEAVRNDDPAAVQKAIQDADRSNSASDDLARKLKLDKCASR